MTDQTLDLDAIEARHAADEAREGEDTGSFFMPMDSQGWATGPAVSYNPLPPIDGERAHADRAALLAEVRKLREALKLSGAALTSRSHSSYRINDAVAIISKALKPKELSA